jgi:co-chaperonin GroES (HSP10)
MIGELDKKLVEAVLEEYKALGIGFEPLYPAVLIRVLPKEHMTHGGLWLPDTKQNKPIYEGIVLRTYPPKRIKLDDGSWRTMDSGLEVGDHICFPHWSGEAVPWLRNQLSAKDIHDEEYRLIPARGLLSLAGMKDSGEPYLIVNYTKESVDNKLKEILQQHDPDQGTCLDDEQVIELIKQEFDIIVKVKASKTVSGV